MTATKVDYAGELAKIEEELKSLVAKIKHSAQCEENEPSSSTIKWFRAHCALQHQVGLAWHRQAELEEEARIERVKHDSVQSGLVVTPNTHLNMGECPLCLSTIPDPHVDDYQTFRRHLCCDVARCINCGDQHERALDAADEARYEAQRHGDMTVYQARLDECESLRRCPFCRTLGPTSMETCYQMELVHAEAGKVWAHFEVGKRLRIGQGVPKDIEASIRWLTKAAEQGSCEAMAELASTWLDKVDGRAMPRPRSCAA
jgi:hypothetical protein